MVEYEAKEGVGNFKRKKPRDILTDSPNLKDGLSTHEKDINAVRTILDAHFGACASFFVLKSIILTVHLTGPNDYRRSIQQEYR